jgi:hypothetical protein
MKRNRSFGAADLKRKFNSGTIWPRPVGHHVRGNGR